jgi:glycerophosphoryl diester phosphodiesterase
VAAVHGAGVRVSTWTVDDVEDMDRVVSAGVDAVVSNHVAQLVAFVHP